MVFLREWCSYKQETERGEMNRCCPGTALLDEAARPGPLSQPKTRLLLLHLPRGGDNHMTHQGGSLSGPTAETRFRFTGRPVLRSENDRNKNTLHSLCPHTDPVCAVVIRTRTSNLCSLREMFIGYQKPMLQHLK